MGKLEKGIRNSGTQSRLRELWDRLWELTTRGCISSDTHNQYARLLRKQEEFLYSMGVFE